MKRISFLVPLIVIVGCGNTPTTESPARPVTTSIPEGIYFGEITTRTRAWFNGELASDETVTRPTTEVVNADGLPLIQPESEPPVQGLVLTRDRGIGISTLTVESVNASGNRLVIGYSSTFEIEDLRIAAAGIWTYEYIPPDTLQFSDQFNGASNVSEFGDFITLEETSTATLTVTAEGAGSGEGQSVPETTDSSTNPDEDQPIPETTDLCPNDPDKLDPGICGCGLPETDSDGDGTPDCLDQCPNDAEKIEPGTCGCGSVQDELDTDADGIVDCVDGCPTDPFKTSPGLCGCGLDDLDLDLDGFADLCLDNCPVTFNPDQLDTDQNGLGDACDFLVIPTQTILVADDGQFLGNVNDNSFDFDSIANAFGTYGSTFNSLSIWNSFGTYGSAFSNLSPWNDFATTPPILIKDGNFVAYITTNAFLNPAIHPNDLAIFVGRTDVLR